MSNPCHMHAHYGKFPCPRCSDRVIEDRVALAVMTGRDNSSLTLSVEPGEKLDLVEVVKDLHREVHELNGRLLAMQTELQGLQSKLIAALETRP